LNGKLFEELAPAAPYKLSRKVSNLCDSVYRLSCLVVDDPSSFVVDALNSAFQFGVARVSL
jgi:hypothetical protein